MPPKGFISALGESHNLNKASKFDEVIRKNSTAYPQDFAIDDLKVPGRQIDTALTIAGSVLTVADIAFIGANGLKAFTAMKAAKTAEKAELAAVKVSNNVNRDNELLNIPSSANKTWGENLSKITKPADRHLLSKLPYKGKVVDKNTVINDSIVDVNADIRAIRNGQGKPINDKQIEVNGRVYQKHDGNDFKLIPVSGNGIYQADRATYKFLGDIIKHNGDINKVKGYASNARDFNANDFNKAVEIYEDVMRKK